MTQYEQLLSEIEELKMEGLLFINDDEIESEISERIEEHRHEIEYLTLQG
ncbi:MAG: hypothetical protein NWE89_11770 [Candidatus Bathyarchaeota archaeon]|nr:hypothetical protein [Candidatus Bathyarchaeota archaeon]